MRHEIRFTDRSQKASQPDLANKAGQKAVDNLVELL
jgi:hypothetical protein